MPSVMQDDGPILVDFYHMPIEDRDASQVAGHYVAKDVEFVRITPAGGNLIVESEVTEVHRQRFERQYDAWKKGIDPPEDGSPLRDWPPASPAQIKTMDAIGIRTVEALAGCTDGILQHAGMGSVALRDKARTWLKSAEDQGRVSEQVASLTVENESLKERLGQLEEAIEKLKPRRGRPPKDQAA
jgi:hypothetical protein